MIRRLARLLACCAVLFSCSILARAQEKKKEEEKGPRVTLVLPLAVVPGSTISLKVRGLRLSEATALRFTSANAELKATVKSKGKAEMPQGVEAAEIGDTQVEVELSVPADLPAGALSFVVVTPAGESKPHELLVVDATSLSEEKEPNDGFRQAQAIALSKIVQGTVQSGEDVDVFRFEAKSGQKFVAEVIAARRGSALDSLVTLYDAAGHVIAGNDDAAGEARTDSFLRFQCPSDGVYSLALTDANSRGGAAHPYLLTLKATE